MGKLANYAVLLCLCIGFAMQAFAQDQAQAKVVATLEVNKGVVMTSTGGEYVTGVSGQKLVSDERLMVTQDSSATVVFNDHCKRTYDTPGVYEIDADCKAVVWFNGAGVAAAIVAGGFATYTIVHNITNTEEPQPPISR